MKCDFPHSFGSLHHPAPHIMKSADKSSRDDPPALEVPPGAHHVVVDPPGGDDRTKPGKGDPKATTNQLLKPKFQNLTKISLGEDTYTIGE